jgi:hypothetical protein
MRNRSRMKPLDVTRLDRGQIEILAWILKVAERAGVTTIGQCMRLSNAEHKRRG